MVGEKLGSYLIEGTLGVGAMGVVYRATHEKSGRPAAVKVVSKEIATRGNAYERFEREAKILQQFRHANIVQFYALGRYKGTSYIAMEYVPGRTLDQVLGERGALPWKEVVDLGIQICAALDYAHEHGVVHRDLKPSNLMVTEDGVVKLADFGIAKDLDATALTATGRTLGTAAYMAPEQIRGDSDVTHKTDLYALGCVFYQLLTGCAPFEGASAVVLMHGHLNADRPVPSRKCKEIPVALGAPLPEIPAALDELVGRLMAKRPQDRPDDAGTVAVRLKEIRDRLGRGEAVPKAWPNEQALAASAGQVSTGAAKPAVKKAAAKRRSAPPKDERNVGDARRTLEVVGLVAMLLVVGGVIAYLMWPPSAPFLYARAERLMASENRRDWVEARDEYLDRLDAKYPDHPYKATTRAWRDKLLLTDTEGRARVLQSPTPTAFNKPNGPYEERFVEYYTVASAAEKRGDTRAAAATWNEMAAQLRPDDQDDRPWWLLATHRSAELAREVERRKARVIDLMARAQKAQDEGRNAEAISLRAEVMERYGAFKDVTDLLGITPVAPAPAPAPDPTPAAPGVAPPGLPPAPSPASGLQKGQG